MTGAWGTDEVCVSYGKIVALDCVSLSAPPGEVTAVVGGDGAGKSTLLRCLAGAIAPDSGTVRRPDKERAGYLPASSGIYPDLTVAENLDFRAVGYGMSRRLARERAAEYLDRAGLLRGRPPRWPAIRRHAAEAGRDRRHAAPPRSDRARRADNGRRPGQPVRTVVADRQGCGRGLCGRPGDHLPG